MIETERLLLRPPRSGDRGALHAMWADHRVMADLAPIKSPQESDATLARHAGFAPLGFWSVVQRDTNAVIGFCGMKPGDENTPIAGMLEIGWMLSVPYWRRGYALEAASASLMWAWAHRDEAEVVAITSARNASSRRLMERLGMHHVPEMDFAHPNFADDDPLKQTVTYRIDRPRS